MEIEHELDTRGDPNDRFEIGFGDQFRSAKASIDEGPLKQHATSLSKKPKPLEHMSVYAG